MKALRLLLPAGALAATALALLPGESLAFAKLGTKLNLTQRDFRVFNNFTDGAANNNQAPHANFPGYQGAVMAIWKACVEWQSTLHGDGTGDPWQGNLLGSGGANFDPSFQGEATATGGTNDNIHSELSGSSGSVFAFTEGPANDGWRIRYYSAWVWRDGPGNEGGSDLQGIATHEYGHALGLGHSGNSSATMKPGTATGIEQRSINGDDIAGIQDIYGAADPAKPTITGISLDPGNGTVTVLGTNLTPNNNSAWFTQAGSGGDGIPIKVNGLASTDGGTRVTVAIPAAAGPGDILVKKQGTGHDKLSNAWPFDPAAGPNPGDPVLLAVNPAQVAVVDVDGQTSVTLTGEGFLDVTDVVVDGITLAPSDYTVVDNGEIDVTSWPQVSQTGSVDVTLVHSTGTTTNQIQVAVNDPPVVQLADSLSEGGLLSPSVGLDVTLGADAGDVHFLSFSGSQVPSVLPGFVSFGIGNNFFGLFSLGDYTIPASGFLHVVLPVSGALSGVTVYLQSAVLDVDSGTVFPLVMSNVQAGQFP